MPSTPSHLKLSFQRNSYSRVSFGKSFQKQERNYNGPDSEPLQGGKGDAPGIFPGVDYINMGLEDQMEIYGYKRHAALTGVSWFFIVMSLGAVRLVFHWWPQWMLYATHSRCPLDVAEKVLIVEKYQGKHKCYYVKTVKFISVESLKLDGDIDEVTIGDSLDEQALVELKKHHSPRLSVHTSGGIFKDVDSVRVFDCKKMRYVWDHEKLMFSKLCGLDNNITTSTLHQQVGLTLGQQYLRRAVYGRNEIVVPLRGIIALLFLEVLNPFYVFQFFSFILWFADDYIYYAFAILIMSTASIVMTIIQTRNNQLNLHSTVHSSDVVSVVRAGGSGSEPEVSVIPTEQLVPGDVLLIPAHGCIMHCDAVLLAGNCIVNESMLTGESVPVTKTPLPNSVTSRYDDKEHARHTLFCGTHVIQTRYYGNEKVYAVVIRTGFSTAKGNLVRSILYPPPVDFKFERDSYKFVQLLAAIASMGFLYTVVTKTMRGVSATDIALDALDLITIVVPPALPAAMTVGRMYAQTRLKKNHIYCISPRTINVSGSINCVCFDKTGTLTEDGLDMWGVVPVENSEFRLPIKQTANMEMCHMLTAMVTCHSLTLIDQKLSGDPLDLKMFECTGWILEEPEVSDETKFDLISPTVVKPPRTSKIHHEKVDVELGIIRQFPFSSSLQRMSVITRQLGDSHFTIYCKGSPEMIQRLCKPDTIPKDFSVRLEEYTREGYRVLGVGYRELPSRISYPKMQRLTREEVEADLCFLGLVVLENRLKPQTTGVISVLRGANIRTVMVTGDNMLTALSVARDCGIIPMGQRVIMVHSTGALPGQPPQLYYTQTQQVNTPTDTLMIGDFSQMTGSNSVASLETMESVTATNTNTNHMPNGTAQNSLMTDIEIPVDNNVCGPHDMGALTNYSFALTGATWGVIKTHYPELVARIATRGAVFSRMSPEQKQQLVQQLQSLGYYVAMCGDGANDCGALKAAHAGISLSEAESSVASPFTSREPNIECIVKVIKEGRAALITSFGIFKYMAAYSLTQFASVMILYSIDSNLTDKQFLYIDLFVITTFAFVLGRPGAYEGPLVSQPPQTSLMSLAPIVSLIGQMLIAVSLQFISFFSVKQFDWFVPFNVTASEESVSCYENYAVFTVSSLQYVILALVFSKGAPYRKSLTSNWSLQVSVFTITLFTLYITLYPSEFMKDQFELTIPPAMDFRIVVVVLSFINFVLSAFHEYFICDYLIFKKLRAKRKECLTGGKKQYLSVERELNSMPDWPPVVAQPPPEPDPEPPRPPRSPATVTMYSSSHNNSTAFPFPTTVPLRVSDIQLELFMSSGDLNIKTVHELPNGVSTLPRRFTMGENGRKWMNTSVPNVNNSCNHTIAQVHQSEDSVAGYLTPPESLHSPSHDTELNQIHFS